MYVLQVLLVFHYLIHANIRVDVRYPRPLLSMDQHDIFVFGRSLSAFGIWVRRSDESRWRRESVEWHQPFDVIYACRAFNHSGCLRKWANFDEPIQKICSFICSCQSIGRVLTLTVSCVEFHRVPDEIKALDRWKMSRESCHRIRWYSFHAFITQLCLKMNVYSRK